MAKTSETNPAKSSIISFCTWKHIRCKGKFSLLLPKVEQTIHPGWLHSQHVRLYDLLTCTVWKCWGLSAWILGIRQLKNGVFKLLIALLLIWLRRAERELLLASGLLGFIFCRNYCDPDTITNTQSFSELNWVISDKNGVKYSVLKQIKNVRNW